MTRIVALLLCLGLAGTANADDADWQLVGKARLTYLFWDLYDSRLYSGDGSYREGQRPVRLDLQYLRDIAAGDLVERTGTEWRKLGVADAERWAWLQALSQLLPDVQAGDTLSLRVDAQGASVFFRNGERLGQIADPAFGRQFLAIWLSPDTNWPELRLALLGRD